MEINNLTIITKNLNVGRYVKIPKFERVYF